MKKSAAMVKYPWLKGLALRRRHGCLARCLRESPNVHVSIPAWFVARGNRAAEWSIYERDIATYRVKGSW